LASIAVRTSYIFRVETRGGGDGRLIEARWFNVDPEAPLIVFYRSDPTWPRATNREHVIASVDLDEVISVTRTLVTEPPVLL
jgi:hypothetical protein